MAMTAILYAIFKVIIVLLLLVGMVLVLLGIHHFFRGERSEEEEANLEGLKRDVEQSPRVISDHSLFRHFLARQSGEREKNMLKAGKSEASKSAEYGLRGHT